MRGSVLLPDGGATVVALVTAVCKDVEACELVTGRMQRNVWSKFLGKLYPLLKPFVEFYARKAHNVIAIALDPGHSSMAAVLIMAKRLRRREGLGCRRMREMLGRLLLLCCRGIMIATSGWNKRVCQRRLRVLRRRWKERRRLHLLTGHTHHIMPHHHTSPSRSHQGTNAEPNVCCCAGKNW